MPARLTAARGSTPPFTPPNGQPPCLTQAPAAGLAAVKTRRLGHGPLKALIPGGGACGCTYTGRCPGSAGPRCDVEPTKDGGWRYQCNAKHTSEAGSTPLAGRPAAACGAAA
jgi:hypothetical protein